MKKRTLFIRLVLFAILLVGLSSFLRKNKEKFVQIDQKLFASRYEVTNNEFREFINESKLQGKLIYDSTQWLKKFPFSYNQPMVNFYHWHPTYDDYPVVNITKETAEAYCKWLTQTYNSDSKRKFNKVTFRLPTEAEWVMLAGNTSENNLPWEGNSVYDSDNKTALANIKIQNAEKMMVNYKFDGNVYTSKVGNFKANRYGLYDIVGNAYELTQTGIQKGGSWDSFLEECKTDKSQDFDLPDPRVGFRVVMEVLEE